RNPLRRDRHRALRHRAAQPRCRRSLCASRCVRAAREPAAATTGRVRLTPGRCRHCTDADASMETHIADITRVIQLAVAPVFLLTAIGTLITVELSKMIAVLFILAMCALIVSLALFLREIFLAVSFGGLRLRG